MRNEVTLPLSPPRPLLNQIFRQPGKGLQRELDALTFS